MNREAADIKRIRDALSEAPHGSSITELSRDLNLHRTTVAKYLDSLQMRGEVDLRLMGTSKIYHIVNRIPSGSISLLHSGYIVFLSSRMTIREIQGEVASLLDHDNLIGREISDPILRPIMQDGVPDLCRKGLSGSHNETDIVISHRGDKKQFRVQILPVVYEDSRPGCALVLTDETRCRKAIEQANMYADELEAIAKEQNEFIFRSKPDGTIVWTNDAFCRRLERSREDIIGYPYEPVISNEDQQRLDSAKKQITQTNPSAIVSFTAIQPDGTVSYEEWTYRGVFRESGGIDGYLGIGKDISRLHHLEEQLQTYHTNFESLVKQRTREMKKANQDLMTEIARRERLERELLIIQFVFNNASDSIILFEKSGKVWRANETACYLLGYSQEDMQDLMVFHVNPEITKEIWEQMWQNYPLANETIRVRSVHKRKDGTTIPVELSRKFISAGNITLFCSIARQILDFNNTDEI